MNAFHDALNKGLISVERPRLTTVNIKLIGDLGFWLLLDGHKVSLGMLDNTMCYTAQSVRYGN